jgi:PKD repeat protein
MKKILLSVLAFALIGMASHAQTVHPDFVDGVVWVKLKDQVDQKRSIDIKTGKSSKAALSADDLVIGNTIDSYGVTQVTQPFAHIDYEGLDRYVKIKFNDASQVEALLEKLNGNSKVELAEKEPIYRKTLTPNDPNFNGSNQWGLFQIGAQNAWNVSTGDANVVVAIVDDAVEITHPDLAPVIWTNTGEIAGNGIDDDGNGYIDDVNGWDASGTQYSNGDTDPSPDSPASSFDHGTHVAGIAGAASNNNTGVASIGYGISLMAVKSTSSPTTLSDTYGGVLYAIDNNADVINMSFGSSFNSSAFQSLMNYGNSLGIVMVAAAGNDNVSSTFYPAGYNNVISVASTTTGDSKSGFSNYGSWIDIAAPGSAIYSTIPGGGYAYKQGTSMASPMVAGLCGLMLSLNPSLSPADIESCLTSTAANIDGANPSYVGQLGAGRIDALAAMNCISATLNWAPEAEFSGDILNILEGQSVNFTDLSIYNPTSWSWTFTGGAPGSFNGQNPGPITYNTAGTYVVSLTVTNANGTDTETKNGYVTVNALTGCDTVSNTLPTDAITTFSWTGGNGLIGGHNAYGMTRFAEQFTGLGSTWVTGAEFYFTRGETNTPSSDITIMVWEDNGGGLPGTMVYSEDVPLQVIEDNVTGPGPGSFYITNVTFDLPVQVTTTDFYVGYSIENATDPADSVACGVVNVTTDNTRPNRAFNYFEAGNPLMYPQGWNDIETVSGLQLVMHIYPRITQTPPTAVITANPNPACVGDVVNFDGSTSPNSVNFEWAINGTGTPYPTGSSPSVVMNSTGNHMAYMAAYNSCGFLHIDSLAVQVDATPSVTLTSTADTVCAGASVNLAASGAATYAWSPGATLSCTNCPNPVASPTSTTTYAVVGTNGNCSAASDYTIVVDDTQPTASYLVSSDTICEGESITYNGAISSGGSSFTWAFTGGSLTSSTSPNPTVTYMTAGTYNVDLTVGNTCSLTDNTSGQVVVLTAAQCGVGVGENLDGQVVVLYDNANTQLSVDLSALNGASELKLMSANGQLIQTLNDANGLVQMNTATLAAGVYMIVIEHNGERAVEKFVK